MKRWFVCCITFGTVLFSTGFQSEDGYFKEDIKHRDLNKKQWEKLTHDLDYSIKETPQEETEKAGRSTPAIKDQAKFADSFLQIFKWVFIILALGLLVWLLLSVLKASGLFAPGFKKIAATGPITLDNIEEHLHETDLDAFLRDALKNKQYNLAIRLYYLSVLKSLSNQELILWKKDKTNKAYLREMSSHTLYNDFREATLIYENAWYGDGVVSETAFLAAEGRMKVFI